MYKVVFSWSDESDRKFIIIGDIDKVDNVVEADEACYEDLAVSEMTYADLNDAEKEFELLKKSYPEAEVTEAY